MADESIRHFSHPGHELVKRHYTGPFICDICWEDLSGPAYGCRAGCDFTVHDSCAGHQKKLSSPTHHPHRLVLVPTRQYGTFWCDVCAGRCASGCFLYHCPPCGFYMHPRCVRLPGTVRSARHPAHDLTLVDADGSCAACYQGAERAWYYHCTACNIDLHVSCAAERGDEVNPVASDGEEDAGASDVEENTEANGDDEENVEDSDENENAEGSDGEEEEDNAEGSDGAKNAEASDDENTGARRADNQNFPGSAHVDLLRARIALRNDMATARALSNIGLSTRFAKPSKTAR